MKAQHFGAATLVGTLIAFAIGLIALPGPAHTGATRCSADPYHWKSADLEVRGYDRYFSAQPRDGTWIAGPQLANELGPSCVTGDPETGFDIIDYHGRRVKASGHPHYERLDPLPFYERIARRAADVPGYFVLVLVALIGPWIARLRRHPPEDALWIAILSVVGCGWAIVPFAAGL